MSVDISMHDTAGNQPKATASAEGSSAWLSIRQGETEITIFASRDKTEAFHMIADAFNDTFQRQAETLPEPAGHLSTEELVKRVGSSELDDTPF